MSTIFENNYWSDLLFSKISYKKSLSLSKNSLDIAKKVRLYLIIVFTMLGIIYAFITVLAWGTWLAPSQNIQFKNQQIKTFFVASANLVLAFVVTLVVQKGQLKIEDFWLPFLGGLIWSVSGFCAFTATHKIGMVKALGVWAPLNIVVSILWGAVLFHEFPNTGTVGQLLLWVSIVIIIAGVLMIIFAKDKHEKSQNKRNKVIGVLAAFGAGILWGSYFIPLKISSFSLWVTAFPLAIGIFIGSTLLLLLTKQTIKLEKSSSYFRVSMTGLLWGMGNYGMLLLVGQLGAGRGFTISQLCVVVNALIGIYILKDPHPGTRTATMTLIGCVLATFGGIILGNLK